MTALQAMLWKYTARCALRDDQELAVPGSTGPKFRGSLGVAPEWYGGTCDRDCQQKVSACLIALTNRTGKHVAVSLLSGADSMGKRLLPSDEDLPFPHQEGAFFGNVFSSEAFACRGRGARKGTQVKRFCALEPTTCSGIANFVDAGACQDACTMRCAKLSDGSERCAAVSCKDPQGRLWPFPITTFLRDQIEGANADVIVGAVATDDGLDDLDDGDTATFKGIDFGPTPGGVRRFVATFAAPSAAGRIEISLSSGRHLGVLAIKATGQAPKAQATALNSSGLAGPNDVTLKFVGGKKMGRLSLIEFR